MRAEPPAISLTSSGSSRDARRRDSCSGGRRRWVESCPEPAVGIDAVNFRCLDQRSDPPPCGGDFVAAGIAKAPSARTSSGANVTSATTDHAGQIGASLPA